MRVVMLVQRREGWVLMPAVRGGVFSLFLATC